MARRRTPGLPVEELRVLAKAMRDNAKEYRKRGLLEQAERFERKAVDYDEKARIAEERLVPKPRR